jgi:ABC-type nickel/cobalt efflux system permease component RcnA
MSTKNYHGVKPPTKEDARLAKSHLDRTMDLEKQKVKEHETQKTKAKKAGNKQSVKYNESHIKNHKKDIAERQQSKKTISQIWDKLQHMRSK